MTQLLNTTDTEIKSAECLVEGGLFGAMIPNLRFKVSKGFLNYKIYKKSDVELVRAGVHSSKRSLADMVVSGAAGGLLLGPLGFGAGVLGGALNTYKQGIYSIQFKDGLHIVVLEKIDRACLELDKLVAAHSFDEKAVDISGESV